MLQVPQAAAPSRETPNLRAYAQAAMLFLRHACMHIWRRRLLAGLVLVPIIAAAGAVVFHPKLAPLRPILPQALAFVLLSVVVIYLSFRLYTLSRRLHAVASEVDDTVLTVRRQLPTTMSELSNLEERVVLQGRRIDTLGNLETQLVQRLERLVATTVANATKPLTEVLDEVSASSWEIAALKGEVTSFYERCEAIDGAGRASMSEGISVVAALRKEMAALDQRYDLLATTQEVRAIASSRASELGEFATSTAALRGDLAALSQRCDSFVTTQEMRSVTSALTDEIAASSRASELGEFATSTAALRGEIATLSQRCDSFVTAHEMRSVASALTDEIAARRTPSAAASSLIAKIGEFEKAWETSTAALRGEIATLSQRCDSLATAEEMRSVSSTLTGEIGALRAASAAFATSSEMKIIEQQSAPANSHHFQRFNRRLTQSQISEIRKNWSKALSVKTTDQSIGYLGHRACAIENLLRGRFATSIEDMTLRTIVALSLKKPEVRILEIGTLFGVGIAVMFDAMAPNFGSIHMTLLDPLDGYYEGGQRDILTGQPINERVLRENFAKVGIEEKNFALIKRMSTDAEAVREASAGRYDVLVIDGDHSFAGVKSDFDNYSPFLNLGGYVIFDDYGSMDWPDVARFVDSEMPLNRGFAHVGTSWRTCVYRATKQSGP